MALTNSMDTYWNNFEFTGDDLEFLYNYLLEKEEPLTDLDLADALISERLKIQQVQAEKASPSEKQYMPKETYQVNDKVSFQ